MGAIPKTETIRHIQAFEYFYWMGPNRRHRAVAGQFKVSEQTISTWSKAFRWEARVAEREQKAADMIKAKGDQIAVQIRQDQITIGRAVVAKFAHRLKPQVPPGVTPYEPSAQDAVRWGAHLLLLTGQATSRHDLTLGQGTIDALVSGIVAVLRKYLPTEIQQKVSAELLEYARSLTAKALPGEGQA